MISGDWKKRLETAVSGIDCKNWYTHYLLGTLYVYETDYEKALAMYRKSVALQSSCWGYYGEAIALYFLKEDDAAAEAFECSLKLCSNDINLARDYCKMMSALNRNDSILKVYGSFSEEVKADPKVRYFYANALCHSGDIKKAEDIVYSDGGLQIPDMREGEESLTDLWFAIERKKAKNEGREFDQENAVPPAFLDFRMTVAKKTT